MEAKQLYDKLLKLRQMENSFDEWKLYRHKITNYIIQNTQPDTTLAIFGAGSCDDFDLNLLRNHFSKITLIDNDENSLANAIKKYKIENDEKLEQCVADFVGIDRAQYEKYIDIIMKEVTKNPKNPNFSKIENKLTSYLQEMYDSIKDYEININKKAYDYTVTVGVHSQLNNVPEWIWHMFMSSYNVVSQKLMYMVAEENNILSKKLNEAILRATNVQAFIGCEKNIVGSQQLIQGAYQAIDDIEQREKENLISIKDKTQFVWPFDKNRNIQYRVMMYNIEL